MSLIKHLQKVFLGLSLVLVLALTNTSWALAQPLPTSHLLGANLQSATQQAKGKIQETVGNYSGNREAQIQGKVKQAEGQIRSVPSDAGGNKVRKNAESEIVGKTQQAESNIRRFQARDNQTTNLNDASR